MATATQNPLHQISALYLSVWDRIDEELGEDGEIPFDLKLCLDAVEGDMKDRWEELAKIVAEYDRLSAGCSEEIRRLSLRSAGAKKKAERIRDYILDSMTVSGFKKHEGKCHTLSVRTNPPSVKILDEKLIPDQYCETRMTLHISKSAISAAIKKAVADGEATDNPVSPDDVVPGAVLVSGKQLLIK